MLFSFCTLYSLPISKLEIRFLNAQKFVRFAVFTIFNEEWRQKHHHHCVIFSLFSHSQVNFEFIALWDDCCRRRRCSVPSKNNQINYGKLKQLPTHNMKFNTLLRFTAYGKKRAYRVIIKTICVRLFIVKHCRCCSYCCLLACTFDNAINSYVTFRESILYKCTYCLRAKKRLSPDHPLAFCHLASVWCCICCCPKQLCFIEIH